MGKEKEYWTGNFIRLTSTYTPKCIIERIFKSQSQMRMNETLWEVEKKLWIERVNWGNFFQKEFRFLWKSQHKNCFNFLWMKWQNSSASAPNEILYFLKRYQSEIRERKLKNLFGSIKHHFQCNLRWGKMHDEILMENWS